MTLRWKDERFCFNATGWDNETTSLSAPGHPPAAHPRVASEGGCHCDSGEREAGLCACLRFGGDALVNASSWMGPGGQGPPQAPRLAVPPAVSPQRRHRGHHRAARAAGWPADSVAVGRVPQAEARERQTNAMEETSVGI